MSPQSNQPPQPLSPPTTTPPQPNPDAQELTALRREKAALSGIIWELVAKSAPETHDVEVMSNPSDPLWQLAFVQSSEEKSGRVRILAGTIKPITEQEKKRVVRLLRGTDKPIFDALTELKLERFPPSYVEQQIAMYVKWSPETKVWQSVAMPTVVERVKNFITS